MDVTMHQLTESVVSSFISNIHMLLLCPSVPLSVRLSVLLFVLLFVCPSVRLSVCPFFIFYLFFICKTVKMARFFAHLILEMQVYDEQWKFRGQ